MRLSSKFLGLSAAVALAGFATGADAATVQYNFTLDGLTGSPLPSEPPDWGYFTVNDNNGSTTDLTFTVVLDNGLNFYFQDDSNHPTGTFDFLMKGTVTNVTNIATTPVTSPVGFAWLGNGSYTAPNIITNGDTTLFNEAISCATDCQGGSVQDNIYKLTFDVIGTNLSLGSISNSKNYSGAMIYGAADVSWTNADGSVTTGNIGATFGGPGGGSLPPPVPEPSTLPLLLAGLVMVGGTFYFRHKKMASVKI